MKRIIPSPEEVPTGICECGCGKGPTGIAPRVERHKRWFNGYHVPFLPGHRLKRRKGKDHGSWKGGRTRNVHGYILLHMPDHPRADTKGYVLEHRYVWEQANGRIPEPHEHIHHLNGIRDDNRIENLVMLTITEHAKLHNGAGFKAYQQKHPEIFSKAGKRGAAARWRNHIKKS